MCSSSGVGNIIIMSSEHMNEWPSVVVFTSNLIIDDTRVAEMYGWVYASQCISFVLFNIYFCVVFQTWLYAML